MSQFDPAHYSGRYKNLLTLALLLLLGTLTISILIVILASADRSDLEANYQATLTVISGTATQSAIQVHGDLAFRASDPVYSTAEACDTYVVTGAIRDLAGEPRNGIGVRAWSDDAADPTLVYSGDEPDAAPGQWRFEFPAPPGPVSRHVWVQIALEQEDGTLRYLSAPVKVTFTVGDCARYQAEIGFEQVTPVE